ncbi:MAG: S-layer homology domain-containing protein [Leptolyngbyaceae cyanobacterium]
MTTSVRLNAFWNLASVAIAQLLPYSAQAQAPTFVDVPTNYWANDYIESLAAQGIISGFPDGSFRPDAPVTRAQYATILHQAFLASSASKSSLPFSTQIAQDTTAETFTDVGANYWATEAINTARASGFLSGYPNNLFRPEQNISRIQALVALTNGLDYTGDDLSVLAYYIDADAIPDYGRRSAAIATTSGLVVNYPTLNQLAPTTQATRADVATFVYQALVKENLAEAILPAPYEVASASSNWQPALPVTTFPVLAKQIALSDDGQRLAALSQNESGEASPDKARIQVWNVQTGESLFEQVADETATFEAIAISHDGRRVAAIARPLSGQAPSSQDLELWLWSLDSPAAPIRRSLGSSAASSPHVSFHPMSQTLVTHMRFYKEDDSIESLIYLHDSATGQISQTLVPTFNGTVERVEFSPDGKLLAVQGIVSPGAEREAGEVIDLWRLSDMERIFSIRRHDDLSLHSMGFTPTGAFKTIEKYLYDVRVSTWNLQTLEPIAQSTEFRGIDRQDNVFQFSPDGVHLFMRGDVAGGRMLNTQSRQLMDWPIYVSNSVFSRDGCYFAASTPKDVQIFSSGCL